MRVFRRHPRRAGDPRLAGASGKSWTSADRDQGEGDDLGPGEEIRHPGPSSRSGQAGYSGFQVGNRPGVHGAPAASSRSSTPLRSTSTIWRSFANTGANC